MLRRVAQWTVCATLLVTTVGTNLFHYVTFDSVYSHAFSRSTRWSYWRGTIPYDETTWQVYLQSFTKL